MIASANIEYRTVSTRFFVLIEKILKFITYLQMLAVLLSTIWIVAESISNFIRHVTTVAICRMSNLYVQNFHVTFNCFLKGTVRRRW